MTADYEGAYETLDSLIARDPGGLRVFAEMMLDSPGTVNIICEVLCHLPAEDLTRLVTRVMGEHDPAARPVGPRAEVIEAAAFQHPRALTPFLPVLWDSADTMQGNVASPWRDADDSELDRLAAIVAGTADERAGARALIALIETERERGWGIVREHETMMAVLPPHSWLYRWQAAGVDDGHRPGYRRLFTEASYHLIFPEAALVEDLPPWLRRRHPTWLLSGDAGSALTGGLSPAGCAAGHGPMRRLLRLDPVPAGCGVTSRSSLDLAYCYRCHDGWEPAFFRHDEAGLPRCFQQPATDPDTVPFEFDDVRPEWTGVLAPTPARWQVQDWAASNGRQNLNRVGGRPSWIQDCAYPDCPGCGRVMPFLAQLDWSHLLSSGGLTYLLWCDPCAISAMVFQTT